MNNSSTAYKTEGTTDIMELSKIGHLSRSLDLKGITEAIDKLYVEGGDSFYNYVEWIGLAKDPDMVVLSSVHHFYFDNDDLKDVNTIINLKQLNQIKYIDVFLNSIFSIIPEKSNFIGCFLDRNIKYEKTFNNIISQYHGTDIKNSVDPYENGITSRVPFLNTVYNLLDSRTDRYMTRENVYSLLNKQGFKVLDMTDLNGLTYFHSQKPRDLRN